jgi:hypothetical protein
MSTLRQNPDALPHHPTPLAYRQYELLETSKVHECPPARVPDRYVNASEIQVTASVDSYLPGLRSTASRRKTFIHHLKNKICHPGCRLAKCFHHSESRGNRTSEDTEHCKQQAMWSSSESDSDDYFRSITDKSAYVHAPENARWIEIFQSHRQARKPSSPSLLECQTPTGQCPSISSNMRERHCWLPHPCQSLRQATHKPPRPPSSKLVRRRECRAGPRDESQITRIDELKGDTKRFALGRLFAVEIRRLDGARRVG